MATYVNNLRLKEITTGDEDGTWGTSTNTNLGLIGEAFSYGVQEMAADANETFTMLDATADDVRSFYLKITSAVSLTATREITLGPNTVSKVWMIENATSGSQIITIKQGSGATVNVLNGTKVMVVTDGAGAGAAVFNANPTEIGGTVTSVGGTGTVQGLTLSGTVTSSGNLTLGGSLADVDLTSQVTGNLPLANGGTGASLTDPEADRILFWDDSTGATRFLTVGSGLQISDTTLSSTDAGGTVTSVAVSGGTTGLTTSGGPITGSGTITLAGTLAVANGGTGSTTASGALTNLGLTATATELNYTGGVTSNIQTQLNAKGVGSVTSVGGTGTVQGLTLSGTVTSSGNLTLGGSLSDINLTSQVTGTLPVANGGTNATTAAGARTSLGAAAYPIHKGIDYTAVSGDVIVVTAGSITITLPATPSAGDTVGIKDGTGIASATSFTVARNGSNIASSATDLTFDVDFGEITMSYIDGTIGWSV
jgi:hypothetical protein